MDEKNRGRRVEEALAVLADVEAAAESAEDLPTIASQPYTPPGANRATTKGRAAGVMLVAGSTPEYIAEVIGFPSPSQARSAALIALSESLDVADKQAIKDVLGARLEALFRTAFKRANDPRYHQREAAMEKALRIIDSQMKLYGVAAPTTLMVGSATDEQINEFVARVAAGRVEALPAEKDVIRGELSA